MDQWMQIVLVVAVVLALLAVFTLVRRSRRSGSVLAAMPKSEEDK